ncbi:MAG: hypothetical protein ACOZNI_28140 [Myxococcota bacterium]
MIALIAAAWAGAYEVLRARDEPGCAALGEVAREELAGLAEEDVQPPWVPVRAARCLVELYPDAETAARVRPWMADPSRAGLALVVVGKLDLLPLAEATELARAALATPDERQRARVQRRLAASERAELRAVVATP